MTLNLGEFDWQAVAPARAVRAPLPVAPWEASFVLAFSLQPMVKQV